MAAQVKINRRLITPEMATRLLELNTSNRKLQEAHVERLANAIKNGEWQFCGESIKVSTDNTLLDGQHRLHAIVRAGTAVEMILVEGLPKESFHVIDTCKRARSAADVLHIAGEVNTNVLAGALTMLHAYNFGDDLTNRHYRPSVKDLELVLAKHPKIRKYTNPSQKLYRLTGPSTAAVLSYLFSLVDATAAEAFMERLATGVGLEQNNPILQLRNILLNNQAARSKLSKTTIAALVIKAFNLYRVGKSVAQLRWRIEETFPAINDMPKKDKSKK